MKLFPKIVPKITDFFERENYDNILRKLEVFSPLKFRITEKIYFQFSRLSKFSTNQNLEKFFHFFKK